jgi:uncharacterized membrane protein YfcA
LGDLIFLTAASYLTATLSGVIGQGGGSILMVLILNVMPPAQAIPFHGVIQLLSTGSRVALFRGETHWGLAGRFAALLLPGVALGMLAFQGMSAEAVKVAIGLFVLSALYLKRLRFFGGEDTPLWFFYPFGFVIGALSIVVGGVGVLFGPFVLRRGLNKEGIVGTQSTLAAMTHLAKIAAFGLVGFSFREYWVEFALVLPAVVLGAVTGKALLGKLNESVFLWVYQGTLVVLSLKLVIWDGLLRMWM